MHPDGTLTNTVIIGSGPAGLAVGACLATAGVEFLILERADRIGASWHNHYDRLHLHTNKRASHLPHLPFPRDYPRYPSRRQVIDYLEAYADHFGLAPLFGRRVTSVRREQGHWVARTDDGASYRSRNVVVATGLLRVPHVPSWPGQETFAGPVVHTSKYTTGAAFKGKDVLVVGFGNSATEIAIDLHEHGAGVRVSVRSPVNVIPRDLLGIPIVEIAAPFNFLPAGLVDAFMAPTLRLMYGNLEKRGLRKLPYGPLAQLQHHQRVPVLDFGVMRLIKDGTIGVHPGIEEFDGNDVVFEDGRTARFDAVILATGFRSCADEFFENGDGWFDDAGTPLARSRDEAPGLHFCGFRVPRGALLGQIAREAREIGAAIAYSPIADETPAVTT